MENLNNWIVFNEIMNSPLPIKWIDKDDKLRGLFVVNENIYQIVCEDKGFDIWKYDFYHYKENKEFNPELTNLDKDKYRVLSTVNSGMDYLYSTKKVDAIIFGATDNSSGRKKLYERFCNDFSKKNNLKYYTQIYSNPELDLDQQLFVLYKETIDMDILKQTIYNTIEEEKFR